MRAFDPNPDADISPTALRRQFTPLAVPAPGLPSSQALIDLGRKLYYDERLSAGNNTSCNSCHLLNAYGVDGHRLSTGHDGRLGGRNAPTVYNAALNFVQFWDGRAANLAAQAKGPILNPVEMGMPSGDAVVARIKTLPGYTDPFKAAFPGSTEPVTFDHFADAVAAFEGGLRTPARWDGYLLGDENALSATEKIGLQVFLKTGCASCHAGQGLGGNSFQKVGYTHPWPDQHDPGRYQVTTLDRDRLVFKVPTLRNIEKTGPYFHDGKVASLDDAVRLMGENQCGKNLTDKDVAFVVAFLKSLTGALPQQYISLPLDTERAHMSKVPPAGN
ncbi:cytochrome-c peroxidase [Edaphobacter flagellatus]|uniref:cytochrome-c peroxidase n=1 Tax=Edaphobacter flagellatus TaxID=1933044 RepID=UPI0021B15DCE|nr:cytochrome c peroxidase [Edaphobacter flagellatus]